MQNLHKPCSECHLDRKVFINGRNVLMKGEKFDRGEVRVWPRRVVAIRTYSNEYLRIIKALNKSIHLCKFYYLILLSISLIIAN